MISADRATARLKPVILSHEQRDLISFLLEEAYLQSHGKQAGRFRNLCTDTARHYKPGRITV